MFCARCRPAGGDKGAARPTRWVGEKALAIAVYWALAALDVETALLAAVNHSGDSDSTGAITGNIVDAMSGDLALPREWVTAVEGRDVLLQLADDFVSAFGGENSLHRASETTTELAMRYPGS